LLKKRLGVPTFAVIWTRPEGAIASFARVLDFEEVPHEAVLSEVDAFADAVSAYARDLRHVFLAAWTVLPGRRGYGLLDYRPGLGVAHLVARMNLRLIERLSSVANVALLRPRCGSLPETKIPRRIPQFL
jgi:hypothetical protein